MSKKSSSLIKSSKLHIFELNFAKQNFLDSVIKEYSKATHFLIDLLWNNKISYSKSQVLDIKNDLLNSPKYLKTSDIKLFKDSWLSARAMKSASAQALSLVKGSLEKRKRLQYLKSLLKKEGKDYSYIDEKLKKELLIKPEPKEIDPDLNSLCSKILLPLSENKTHDFILNLKSLVKVSSRKEFKMRELLIPLNKTKHYNKLINKNYKLMSGIQISSSSISLRLELKAPKLKTKGRVVGADQGIVTCLTLSDRQVTSKDIHGHDLNSILKKIENKKVGSKAFHRAKAHKENYINWSLNNLNFSNIKEIRMEKISDFRKGKVVSKKFNYWGEALIKRKVQDLCSENGVRFTEQSSAFRSQRCSSCGYVDEGNRKEKEFHCLKCFFKEDADYNASCNHEQDIPSLDYKLYVKTSGLINGPFFWKKNGIFDLGGQEITVPDKEKVIFDKDIINCFGIIEVNQCRYCNVNKTISSKIKLF